MVLRDPNLFRQRLSETIAWCKTRNQILPLEHSLRSLELHPKLVENVSNKSYVPLLGETHEERVANVEDVATRRLQLSQNRNIPAIDPNQFLGGGDLLIFSPDNTLSDGAAAVETNRFFDDENVPPWDTWITFVEVAGVLGCSYNPTVLYGLLICWVPPELMGIVDLGVNVNPERCIDWARNDDNNLTKELKSLKILN